MLNKILTIAAGIILITSSLSADEKIPKNWYYLGSYEYSAPDQILMHFKGKLSYTKNSGNVEDDKKVGSVSGKIRRNHLGLDMSYSVDKQDRTEYDEKDVVASQIFRDDYQSRISLTYDLNEDFFLSAGYENGRNISFEIYNQTTQYAGVGYRILKSKGHKLGVFAAYGNDDISFGTYPILPSGKTDGAYFMAKYLWFVTPTIAFKADASFLKADMENRNTGVLTIATKLGITENLSIVLSYTNEYVEAQKTVNRMTNDETIFTSIQLDFSSIGFGFLGL